MREIRKLRADGHQAAVISADWQAGAAQIAAPQFGRWYQENFFKYGREHFNLDRQIETLYPGTDLRMIFRSVSS